MASRAKTLILFLSVLLLSTTLIFSVSTHHEEELQRELQGCRQDCRESGEGQEQQRWQCEQRCEQQYDQKRRRHQGQNERSEWEGEQEQEWSGRNNPYVFKEESVKHQFRGEHGRIWVLENFLRRSKLHLGTANYRIAFLEADPHTFAVPTHFDADVVLFVLSGEGTITKIRQNKDRESHDIRQGDIIKVSAGTVVYLINKSNNQKIQLVKLLVPVNTPGQFEAFPTVGGNQPESYYRAFSNDIIEAAFNANRDELQRVFGQQRQGLIVRASQEQIRSLSRDSSGSSSSERTHWPFGGGSESRRPINIFNQRPTFSNNHGQLHIADRDEDLDIRVTYMNITQGSMLAPSFNSRSTRIVVVRKGCGRLEMVCPHLSQQGQQQKQQQQQQQQQRRENDQEEEGNRYQLLRSEVERSTVYIVPPGHPATIVSEGNDNLELVSFEINAKNNVRQFLAGRNNVVSKMEREAQELAFGVPSQLVERVFGEEKQQEQVFLRGPQQQRGGGGQRAVESILDFTGF